MKLKEFKMLTPFSVKQIVPTTTPVGTAPVASPEAEVVDKTNDDVIVVAGYANYAGLDPNTGNTYTDLVDDVVVPSGVDVSVWESNPQILLQHDRDTTIGKGLLIEKRSDGLYIEAEIHKGAVDALTWYRIKSGLLNHFSIGFRSEHVEYKELDGDDAWFILKSLLLEVSVVGIPANSPSKFQLVKSADGTEGFRASADQVKATKTNQQTEEDIAPMKIKVKAEELLSADQVALMKSKGLEVNGEMEVELVSFIKQVVVEAVTEVFAAKEAAEVAAKEAIEAEEKKAAEVAAKEAAEVAAKEAIEAEEKEAAEVAAKEAAAKDAAAKEAADAKEKEAADAAALEAEEADEAEIADDVKSILDTISSIKSALAVDEK